MDRFSHNRQLWPFVARQLCKGLFLLAFVSTSQADIDDSVSLSLPPQKLSDTLIELGGKAKVSIIFSDRLVTDLKSGAIKGDYPLLQALKLALAGSGLEYRVISKRSIAIVQASSVQAEQEASGRGVKPVMEEVVIKGHQITGSRLRQRDTDGFAPVEILTAMELRLSGAQALSDQLQFIPIISGNSTSTAVSNGGDGTATVTLRGLPASNTLVLLNGHRIASNGFGGDAVDINTIPPAAIERIEILKDGASAIYGSDAIAGVVNIILHKEYEGLQLETYYGRSGHNDNDTVTTNIIWGRQDDLGSFMLAASYFNQGGFNSRDRELFSSADSRALGGNDKRSTATPAGRIVIDGDAFILRDGLTGSSADNYRQATDEDLFNYAQFTSSLTPSERASAYFNGQRRITNQLSVSLAASYTQTQSEISFAPTPVFTAFELTPITVSADNPFNPFGVQVDDLRRRLLEVGDRTQVNKNQASRLSFGLIGSLASWDWSVHYNWSQTRAKEQFSGLVNANNLQQGVGPTAECIDGCVPINLFGPSGSLDSDQAAFLRTGSSSLGNTQLRNLTADFSRNLWQLPAGGIGFAFGFEVRHESISITPDELAREGALIGGANFTDSLGTRNVYEGYMEWLVPLFAERANGAKLELSIAVRHSEYSDFGATTTPKTSLKYELNEQLMVRTTYSEGFRAPSLIELFKGTTQTQSTLSDPCSNPANVGVLPGCQQQTDPQRSQYLTLLGGNSQLTPETSRNFSIGTVWRPAALEELSFSVDYFDIDQRDIIDANAQFFITNNAETGQFGDRVVRDDNGEILRVISTKANLGRREIAGFDFGLSWSQDWYPVGMITTNLSATRLHKYISQVSPLALSRDLAGSFEDDAADGNGALPEWKVHFNLYWQRNQWEAAYSLNYIGALDEVVPDLEVERTVEPWTTHDLQFGYLFQDTTRLTVGVDNIFDTSPPFVASAFNDNYDGRNYDGVGRFWYARLAYDF